MNIIPFIPAGLILFIYFMGVLTFGKKYNTLLSSIGDLFWNYLFPTTILIGVLGTLLIKHGFPVNN